MRKMGEKLDLTATSRANPVKWHGTHNKDRDRDSDRERDGDSDSDSNSDKCTEEGAADAELAPK